jgi:5'(3')-deoxyribonucleotidase
VETKLKLLVDIDGVCRNSTGIMAAIYRADFGVEPVFPISAYDMKESFPELGDPLAYFYKVRQNADVILGQSPVEEGCKEVLKRLSGNFEIVFVSYQFNSHNRRLTDEWLLANWLSYPVVYVREKYRVPGAILIDDYVKNLESFEDHGGLGLCFDRPWNQDYEGPRAETWYDVEDQLTRFLERMNEELPDED